MEKKEVKKLDQSFWEAFIGNYKASEGFSKKAYCEHHGVSYSTFKKWQTRLKSQSLPTKSDTFVPLVVKSSSQAMDASSKLFRLKMGSGCFEFSTSIEMRDLERVLRLLGVVT